MKKSTYLWLQLKRTLKIYPSVLLVTMITLLSIVLAAGFTLKQNLNSEDLQKMKVGLVGDVSESYLGIGLYALQNMDSSRFSFEFIEMGEDDAKTALENRDIMGYIKVPDDFVYNVAHGNNYAATYVTLNAPESFGTVMTAEVTQTVSNYVTQSQNSMQGIYEIAKLSNRQDSVWQNIDNITLLYLDQLLSRDKTYTMNVTGVADTVSLGGYYVCGILIFFLLIWGISCNKILLKSNYALAQTLKVRGIKTVSQVLCEYLGFLLVTFITFLLFAIAFGTVVSKFNVPIPEFETTDALTATVFMFKMLPVIAMITAMQMLLYEAVSGTVNAILLQFLTSVTLAYISGCFYPNTFFPEAIQKIANATPAGMGFAYMRKTLTNLPATHEFFASVLYTGIFASLTVAIRKYRMVGDRH